jgi:hypothetical protein
VGSPRRSCAGAFIATIIVTAACDTTPTNPSPGSAVSRYNGTPVAFAGRVLDNTTGAGIANATVRFELDIRSRAPLPPASTTTDASGSFTLRVPPGTYEAYIGGVRVGRVRVTAIGSRGDLFVNGGGCGSRYGVISELLTGRPVAGASVFPPNSVSSDSEGWYRWNTCPEPLSFNTRAISVSHPDYVPASLIIGMGTIGVQRLDIQLVRRARPSS